ncbi:MAG TPA: biotin/lipoyl-binding protein [Anaeromyxobacteraceae bacterium]|nr:biotin/lipoyl-binding protein [Anaeromyxobacteraceae bacterium]
MSPADPARREIHLPPPDPAGEGGAAPAAPPPRRRRRLLMGAGAALALVALAAAIRLFLLRGDQVTDDAQVEADVVAIAPRVGGPVAEVLVADDARVEAGQPLLRVDPADYDLRVRQAEAELETARAQATAADAQVQAARAGVSRSEAEAEKAELDLRRAEALKAGDAIAAERYDASRIGERQARAGAGANRAQYAAALANVGLARARVQAAVAALDLARLQRSYTEVRAPAAGVVSRLSARVGQIVQAGQALAELVPSTTYVVANFKETQTGAIRAGQRADVEVDAYGGKASTNKHFARFPIR